MKKIVVLCVNYHNHHETLQYVAHLKKQTVINQMDIIITDNSESDDEYLFLKENIEKDIYLYQAEKNLGYIHGIRYGLIKYLEVNEMPQWMVISNTDISYQEDSFYEKLLTYYPNGYDCVLAPCIYSVFNNLYQNPLVLSRYTKLKMFILTFVFKYTIVERVFDFINRIKNRFQERKVSLLPNQEIYSGHGACLILNKQYFLKGGNLDYGGFLFGEELYIAEMVKKMGSKVYFDNRLKVSHHEHGTISKEKRKLINQFYFDSMVYLYRNFY